MIDIKSALRRESKQELILQPKADPAKPEAYKFAGQFLFPNS